MGEKMTDHNLTAENLARRIRVQLAEFNDDNLSVQALVQLLVDFRRDAQRTIAHLTQPAQAVDVDAVRAVIEQTREYYERTDDRRTAYALENVLSDIYETLTAALPNADGKEG